MSFKDFVESKKRPTITLSLDHYREAVERDVYDTLLDPIKRGECVLAHLAEVLDLRQNLQIVIYPKSEELLMSIASREPIKIRRAHEQFSGWAKGKDLEITKLIEASLFECRSYLYGKEVEFSKEIADKIVREALEQTKKNAAHIIKMIEQAIGRMVGWHNSSVIFKVLKPDEGLVSSEGMVIIGQPPSMTFMCNNKPVGFEVYDIQDLENFPISVQEDYTGLLRSLQSSKPQSVFLTMYAAVSPKECHRYEQIKRELALGMEATLLSGLLLSESPPNLPDMDVWRVKFKNVHTESCEAPIRWLDLFRKAE